MRNMNAKYEDAIAALTEARDRYYATGKKSDLSAARAAERVYKKVAKEYDQFLELSHKRWDSFCHAFVKELMQSHPAAGTRRA